MEVPGDDGAVPIHAAADFDHAGGTEVRPAEFFLPRPHQLYRLAGSLGETRRFNRCIAGVLTAVAGSCIRHDDPHLVG